MPVIDELYIRNKDGLQPVDSIENKMLDEIVVGGQSYHFAKESAAADVNNVVCDNAVEEPLTALVAVGNTTQQTYTGSNLFDLSQNRYSGAPNINEKTANSITVSGGGTTWKSVNIAIPNWQAMIGKQITIKAHIEKSSDEVNAGLYVRWFSGGLGVGSTSNNIGGYGANVKGDVKYTGTVKQEGLENYPDAQLCVAIYSNTNGTGNDGTQTITYSDIMVSYKDVSYEPYVGGKSSPNPDYPQPIINYSEKHEEILAKCKNLINPDKLAEIIISKKGNQIAEIIQVDGRRCIRYMNSTTNAANFTAAISEPFKPNTRYVFSFEARVYKQVAESSQYTGALWFGFKPSGVNSQIGFNGKTDIEFSRKVCISNAGKTVSDINLSWGSMCYWLIDLDSIYLYEYTGDSNPEYIPHHTIDEYKDEWEELEISGNNLFTPDLFITKSNYMNIIAQRDGEATHITGTATSNIYTSLVSTNADGRVDMPKSWLGKTLTFATFGNSTYIEFGFYYFNEETQKWTLKASGASTTVNNSKFKVSLTTETKFWARVRHVKNHVYDDYVKIMCVEGDYTNKDLPYEPYVEPQIVKIPPKIGNLVLKFAKYGDTYDSLEVDNIAKKVIYTEKLKDIVIGAGYWSAKYYYASSMGIQASAFLPQNGSRQKGYCSHATQLQVGGANAYSKGGLWLGVNNNYVYWIGIITLLGLDAGWASKSAPTDEEWTAARNSFRAWLKEQEANGNPFRAVYVLPKAGITEHDITDSEFGQQLLSLAANKGTNYIKITGDTSSLGVGYWRQVIPDEEI